MEFVVEMREDVRDKVETYPALPRPATVDVNVSILVPPGPKAVEKEERATPMEFVVEINEDVKERVETYPALPNPATVENRLFPDTDPPSNCPIAVENEENACPIKDVET